MNEVLAKDPQEYYQIPLPEEQLAAWKSVPPLTVQELVSHGMQVNKNRKINKNNLMSGEVEIGQLSNVKQKEGIGRHIGIAEDGAAKIREGFFKFDELDGYGREFFEDGSYYIGMFKNSKKHGQGKLVDKDGTVKEKEWNDGE